MFFCLFYLTAWGLTIFFSERLGTCMSFPCRVLNGTGFACLSRFVSLGGKGLECFFRLVSLDGLGLDSFFRLVFWTAWGLNAFCRLVFERLGA